MAAVPLRCASFVVLIVPSRSAQLPLPLQTLGAQKPVGSPPGRAGRASRGSQRAADRGEAQAHPSSAGNGQLSAEGSSAASWHGPRGRRERIPLLLSGACGLGIKRVSACACLVGHPSSSACCGGALQYCWGKCRRCRAVPPHLTLQLPCTCALLMVGSTQPSRRHACMPIPRLGANPRRGCSNYACVLPVQIQQASCRRQGLGCWRARCWLWLFAAPRSSTEGMPRAAGGLCGGCCSRLAGQAPAHNWQPVVCWMDGARGTHSATPREARGCADPLHALTSPPSRSPTMYPFFVSLRDPVTNDHICGAALINKQIVLTAGHVSGWVSGGTGKPWQSMPHKTQ